MDLEHLLSASMAAIQQPSFSMATNLPSLVHQLIPYTILVINFILFKLMRSLVDKLLSYYLVVGTETSYAATDRRRAQQKGSGSIRSIRAVRLVKLFAGELISTCELCADCAELNVVYEKHGSLAYGAALFLLSYLWMEAFGEAHTTPGYLVEELVLIKGNELFRSADTYARFVGQSLAAPLAWRFASLYWHYHLLSEHKSMLISENCTSSLSTSTLNGFLIELTCCLTCRLIELCGHKLLKHNWLSQRAVSLFSSLACTTLVVLALELSGGYFNPILALSLEFGCKGIYFYQHALVFWLAPLLGHVFARGLFRRLAEQSSRTSSSQSSANKTDKQNLLMAEQQPKRPTRSAGQRRKQAID